MHLPGPGQNLKKNLLQCLINPIGFLSCLLWFVSGPGDFGRPPETPGRPRCDLEGLPGPPGPFQARAKKRRTCSSAQVRVVPTRLGGMPRVDGTIYLPNFSSAEAEFYRRRFNIRCVRVADIYNRPAFKFLRSRGLCPAPPHCGLLVGQRSWHACLRTWRDYGYAFAALHGFVDRQTRSSSALVCLKPRGPRETTASLLLSGPPEIPEMNAPEGFLGPWGGLPGAPAEPGSKYILEKYVMQGHSRSTALSSPLGF